MRPEVEARYLGLEWLERGRARQIEVAPESLDIELGPDGVLRVETQIFHDFHPWLGLRLTGQLTQSTPAFINAQGQQQPMLALADGAGGTWWVQNDGWDAGRQRHLSELHRTMGRFEVSIASQRLLIENVETGLGRAQLDEYLQDFKRDLIWLVLSSGTATAAGPGTSFVDELPAALADFTAAAALVAVRPARLLREISANTPRSRLRPNAATFRHQARQPSSQRLVGRASEETADTADNRYLRQMVRTCGRLALTAAQAVQQQAVRFAEHASFEDERSVTYGATVCRQVDPEVFDCQLAELKAKLDLLADWSDTAPDGLEGGVREYRMKITTSYGGRKTDFFFSKPAGPSAFDRENNVSYNVVRLPAGLGVNVISALSFCNGYTLTGKPDITLETNMAGKTYLFVNFSGVMAVEPDRQKIEAKYRTRARLERNGWQHDLSRAEHEELQREARTAALRGKSYREVGRRAQAAALALESCQTALRRQDAHWESLGVPTQSTFPMGMRYALSPDYAAVLKAFTRVRALAERVGIGGESLDDINRIGILHASALYERWCLVKIIGVLIEDFSFEIDSGWQDVVIRAVTGRAESASLVFHRQDIGISATLEIQPLLDNGRRPDFRLHFNADADSDSDALDVCTIVMDAKFRTRWQRGAVSALLTELVAAKGYDKDGARMFILQPQAHAVAEPTSPLAWGQHCDYGQNAPANHRTGNIQLAAGAQDGGTQHNLRRLVAMGLQAVFPAPNEQDSVWTSKSFCICCGTCHKPGDVAHRITRRNRDYWILGCGNCGMDCMRTHCYDCGAGLFKNGVDLTYHRTLADQITNAACPKCGAYFDRDWYNG